VEPSDLAGLITFLASDDASLISGQSIVCDGGFLLH
jgi:NAD(P)-dependent dehydrogenase (short-subunit alcohol dehydrogenase family)